jgi:hypothetical protein
MFIRHGLPISLGILLLTGTPAPLRADDSIRLQRLGGGLLAVPVKIARTRFLMLLDTGATRSVVPVAVANRLHLTPRARFVMQTPTGSATAFCAGPVTVRLGSSEVEIPCLAWSPDLDRAAFGDRIEGVLAADALIGGPIRIDARHRRLVLGRQALAVTGREVPLSLVEGRPAVALETRMAAAGLAHLRFVLDSGANQMILFGQAARARATKTTELTTLNGNRHVGIGPAPRLQIVPRAPRRAVLLPAVTDRQEDGLLPLSALGSVAFDWQRQVAILGAWEKGFAR